MGVIQVTKQEVALFILQVSVEIPAPANDGASGHICRDVVVVDVGNAVLEFMADEEAGRKIIPFVGCETDIEPATVVVFVKAAFAMGRE